MLSRDERAALTRERDVYLTTTGRKTGLPRTVELWFANSGDFVLLMAHARAQSCRNLSAHPSVTCRVGQRKFRGDAEQVTDQPAALARCMTLFRRKYGAAAVREWYENTQRVAVRIRVSGRIRCKVDLGDP